MNNIWLRKLLGFLIAPGIPALLTYAVCLYVAPKSDAIYFSLILVICAYVAAVVIGVPAYFFMKRYSYNSLAAYLLFGAFVGLLFYVLLFGIWSLSAWQTSPEHAVGLIKNSIYSSLIAILYASFASVVFWLISIKKTSP